MKNKFTYSDRILNDRMAFAEERVWNPRIDTAARDIPSTVIRRRVLSNTQEGYQISWDSVATQEAVRVRRALNFE